MIKKYGLISVLFLIIGTVITIELIKHHNAQIDQEDQVELNSTYASIGIARRWIAAHHYPIADNMFSCFTNPLERHGTDWHACRATMPDGHTEDFSCNHAVCEPGNLLSKL